MRSKFLTFFGDKGTRCLWPAFERLGAITQTAFVQSSSVKAMARDSLVRVAVGIQISKALEGILVAIARSSLLKAGSS